MRSRARQCETLARAMARRLHGKRFKVREDAVNDASDARARCAGVGRGRGRRARAMRAREGWRNLKTVADDARVVRARADAETAIIGRGWCRETWCVDALDARRGRGRRRTNAMATREEGQF